MHFFCAVFEGEIASVMAVTKMYPRKWTDERVQNPDMKTIRVHRIPFCGQVRAKTLNSGQIGCEKLDSAETDVYNCIIKEG